MDAANPVVKLCADGMMAEAEGRADEAKALFARAWAERSDDFEACVAAHYVARHQPSAAETLQWNREALARADAVADERMRGFYPSLLLNVGRSYEDAGDWAEARRYYTLADARAGDLPPDGYAALVRRGIAAGLGRCAAMSRPEAVG